MKRLSHNVVISCLSTSLNIFTAKLFTGLVEPDNFAKSCICSKHHLRPQGFNMVSHEIILNLQICAFLKHSFRWTHGGGEGGGKKFMWLDLQGSSKHNEKRYQVDIVFCGPSWQLRFFELSRCFQFNVIINETENVKEAEVVHELRELRRQIHF